MEKRGLRPDVFRIGSEAIVGGFIACDNSRTLAGWIITFPEREGAANAPDASFALGR